jgi:lipopolysaccharide transport protein LptA
MKIGSAEFSRRSCPVLGALGLVGLALSMQAGTRAAGAPAQPAQPDRAAASTQKPVQQKFGETTVTAANIDYDLGKRLVIATGSVELISGNNRLTSDKMTVQMAANRGLQWARCDGRVYIEKKDPEGGRNITGNSDKLEYFETEQKANLQGDVTVNLASPRLAKPAVVTGSRMDINLATQENVVHRSPDAQAKVHVEPKGQEGKPAPEPVDLVGDKIEMNGRTQEYRATGKPMMVRPSSKLQAKTIRFQVEEASNEVKVAYAEEDVIFDGKGETGSTIHTTGDHAVFTRETNELVLTGNVVAHIKEPDEDEPSVYKGDKFIYNTLTRAARLIGSPTRPATVYIPPGKGPAEKPGEKAEKPAEAAGGGDKKKKN